VAVSTSDSSFEPISVHLTITTEDGASELLLLNGAYNQVGQGIGSLSADVAPGAYHVRQRIGDTEFIEQIDIGPDDGPRTLTLKPLDFPSPAPIIGTSTFPKANAEDWKKPADLVGTPGIRVAIRTPGEVSSPASIAMLAHLRTETGRLRIETMDGHLVCDFKDNSETANLEESALFIRDVAVPPGHYVLVQSIDGERQLCLSLIVHPLWSPRIYLICQRNQEAKESGSYLPVSLDDASIIYWPCESPKSPSQPDLIRLEAARQALASDRSLGGFTGGGAEDAVFREPMLSLLDAYLLLKDMRLSEAPQVLTVINAAAGALSEEFPDVIALRYGFWTALRTKERSQGASSLEPPTTPGPLSGPPLLAHSWRLLLNCAQTNAELSAIMPSEFIPEASRTWFVWSEKKGARRTYFRIPSEAQDVKAPEEDDVAFRIAQAALVALMETGAVHGWVDQLVKVARRHSKAAGFETMAPLLIQLIDGLSAIQNPLLQTAFGRGELARRLLLSFNLPTDRLKDLLKMLNAAVTKEGLMRGKPYQLIRVFSTYLLQKLKKGGGAPPID
jgi:hypothetical protein